jgi:predicted metal-dependent phosphoesterase TrpH
MYKVDLHTHSMASPDGGIDPEQYANALQSEMLDFIAITDHDRIDFALGLNKALGNKIIVGEEITTADGEIIGLFLTRLVEPGLRAIDAAHNIRDQGGLVYIPHPFETVRKGITMQTLDEIADIVDIIEVHNGRALLQNYGPKAAAWAKSHGKAGASSSDAHGYAGLGNSYSIISEPASRGALVSSLSMQNLSQRRPPLYSLLYPKLNRTLKKMGLKHA